MPAYFIIFGNFLEKKQLYKFKKMNLRFPIYIACTFILFSCVTRKEINYFQDEEINASAIPIEPIFEPGDIVSCEISGAEPEVIKLYNQSDILRQGNQNATYNNGVASYYGYLLQNDSTIHLPVIGPVKIGGKSRYEAVNIIKDALKDHIENPEIALRILNFKISVLGEVNNPGTFTIPNEKVSVIEAIGIAGDLKITGKRANITVIRDTNGIKQKFILDITSSNIFNSPAYYLKQNDIVYVEPNVKSRYDASLLRNTGGVIISGASLIISTLVLLTK